MSLPPLFTSHYRSKLLTDVDAQAVGISRGVPRWRLPYSYRRLMALAPSREAFALSDPDEFDTAYVAGLEALGPDRIAHDLRRVSGGQALVLLCWEDLSKSGQWCHRHLFADWFEEQTGIQVPELAPGMVPQRPEAIAPTLFD